LNRSELMSIAEKLIKISPADQTQISFDLQTEAFSRFNQNYIHQNLMRTQIAAQIKVVVNKRLGSITVSDIRSWDKLEEALNQAMAIAKMQPPSKSFVSLPYLEQEDLQAKVDDRLMEFSAMDRAAVIGRVIAFAELKGLESSGTFSITTGQKLVMNSLGLAAYTPYAHGFFRTIMNNGQCTGYADQVITNMDDFHPMALAELAAEKALVCNEPLRIEPGKYTVLLEPIAVADLIRFCGLFAFGGDSVEQKRSYFGAHLNEQIVDPRLSITDDAHHPLSPVLPFDNEGVGRQVVPIIARGVAAGAVYNSATAYTYGKEPTGHSGGRGNGASCAPAFMVMNNGDTSRADLIKQMDKGIIINRFHYTSCPEPYRVVATGTSRDGTMWVEDGKIVRRINNVRFTLSVIDLLNNVIAIGNDARPTRDWWSDFYALLPSLLVRDFNVSGTTTF